MQDLIRVGIADSTQNAWISQRPFQSSILCRKCSTEFIEIDCKDIKSTGIDRLHLFFVAKQMKGGTSFGACFVEHKRSVGKVEGRKIVASTEFRPGRSPVKTARNHQVQHHPDAIIELDSNPFPNPSQRTDMVAFNGFNGGLHRTQQKCVRQAYPFEGLADDACLQCAEIGGDVG